MLPASVILTNRLINSSEAKDNSKVMQLYRHILENMREILSWLIGAKLCVFPLYYYTALPECFLCPSVRSVCLLTLG